MKKLIVAAAAIVMGVSAFASTVTWSGTVMGYDGVTANYNAFLVNAASYATAADAVAAIMDGSAAKAGDIWYSKTAKYAAASGKVGISGVAAQSMTGNGAGDHSGAEASFWSIILDGTIDGATKAQHYTASLDGASPTKVTATNADLFTLTMGDKSAATTWYAIPEPTSGLLLLLGVAGLALRRRRA